MPEIVALLVWSSKLTHLGKSVVWAFLNPSAPIEGIDHLRFHASLSLGSACYDRLLSEIERLRVKAQRGKLYPGERRSAFSAIRRQASAGQRPAPVVSSWLDAEAAPFQYMDVLAYLERYAVFERAIEVGIVLTPDPRELVKSAIAWGMDTPCLELRSILSLVEVGTLVGQLCQPEELARVLGGYANLDVVRRGALANILVTELGHNVAEHSNGSAAWLCTRLVDASEVTRQTSRDPVLQPFRQQGTGFLEVIVCDNGDGLTVGLDSSLNSDRRESVQAKYSRDAEGQVASRDLVDYAFDRLSSTKRDIAQLVHLHQRPDLGGPPVST